MRTRSIRRLAPLALLLAAFLVVAGCNDDSDSDEAKVKSVVTGFFDDLADGRAEEACDALTSGTVKLLSLQGPAGGTPATCPANVATVHGQLSEEEKEAMRGAKVKAVTVNGDTATVNPNDVEFQFEGQSTFLSSARSGPVVLRKFEGDWKLESLG
jgi:hypothetical protein